MKIVFYGMAGFVGLAINLAGVGWMSPWIGPQWALAIPFPFAVWATWMLNRHWVFQAKPKTHQRAREVLREFIRYFMSNLFAIFVTYSVYLMALTAPEPYSEPKIALLFGALCGFLMNYGLASLWVFGNASQEPCRNRDFY